MRTDATLLAVLAALAASGCMGLVAPADDHVLPSDVIAFLERRVLCEHFLGEDGYDDERRQFLARSIDATCRGTDAALIALRTRYGNDPDVLERLAEYEYPLGY